jgi:hypothetical protein
MSNNLKSKPSMNISYKAIGMAVGLVFGGIIGLIIDNMIIFAGGGLVLGFAIGAAVDNRRKEEDPS